MKIIYHSSGGRFAGDPRAVHQALRSGGDTGRHLWLADPRHRTDFPAGVETVEYGTAGCRRELESADVVVSDSHLELDWDKSPMTRYLQTGPGTPVQHRHPDAPGLPVHRRADVSRWDCLLSPSRAATEVLRTAFGFTGPVLETGSPRNDILLSPDRDAIRAGVRDRLGLPADARVVLYAPTRPDDRPHRDPAQQLDPAEFIRALGDGYILLVRSGFPGPADRPAPDSRQVRDVSEYPEAGELYLAADLMVTGSSPAMVDFAVTGKPLILYAYDLGHYRDSLRDSSFDLHRQAPGPLLHTSTGVVQAIAELDAVRLQYASAYREFRNRFCPLDDGAATARVIDQFFAPAPAPAAIPAPVPAPVVYPAADTAVLVTTPAPAGPQ